MIYRLLGNLHIVTQYIVYRVSPLRKEGRDYRSHYRDSSLPIRKKVRALIRDSVIKLNCIRESDKTPEETSRACTAGWKKILLVTIRNFSVSVRQKGKGRDERKDSDNDVRTFHIYAAIDDDDSYAQVDDKDDDDDDDNGDYDNDGYIGKT
ncbi:hypothetical protein DPMN_144878 [Dreissena polymorpha]|uniref:Uncharacterized protein n=1 Tax=Dreissena polymorpha TaxID=45954 RepID=A0A9D4F3Y4_DREPO|nr:hypothetical protein DPMN_144878 [Dreissena polymorpha]